MIELPNDHVEFECEGRTRTLRFIDYIELDDGTAPSHQGRVYLTLDGLQVIASNDETQHGLLLHVSATCAERYPTWEELVAVRGAFFGDGVDAMMMMPRQVDYVNLHPNCFHIWETPTEWGVR